MSDHAVEGDDANALTPLQRLQQSRERMRHYLLPPARKPRTADADDIDVGFIGKIGDKLGEWRHHPLVSAVIDAVEGWWAHHPLRSVTDIGSTAARELAYPLVRSYPVASVAGALVVGALLMRLRPWRWVLRPALFAGLTTHVVTRLLSDAPLEFVMSALMKLRPQARPESAPATPGMSAVEPEERGTHSSAAASTSTAPAPERFVAPAEEATLTTTPPLKAGAAREPVTPP